MHVFHITNMDGYVLELRKPGRHRAPEKEPHTWICVTNLESSYQVVSICNKVGFDKLQELCMKSKEERNIIVVENMVKIDVWAIDMPQ